MKTIFSLWDWLDFVESFPFVPRWRWTDASWKRWKAVLSQHQIPCRRDSYGNVLLGATRANPSTRILQAHLDHPGALVTSLIDEDGNNFRYSAVIQGGLSKRILGATFQLYDSHGNYLNEVLVDKKTEGIREEWITFKTNRKIELPGYLTPPKKTPLSLTNNGWKDGDSIIISVARFCSTISRKTAPTPVWEF